MWHCACPVSETGLVYLGANVIENSMKLIHLSALFGACALSSMALSGCNKVADKGAQATAQADAPIGEASAPVARSANDRKTILAAAERFENLTEAAFNGSKSAADALALAHHDAQIARPLLNATENATMDRQVKAIDAAATAGVAADISLASVEVYRTLITAAGGEGKIPVQIGLLDYSGFRFWADAKASPPHWADMTQAHDFAVAQWQLVKPRIHDPVVVKKFGEALEAMAAAVAKKDASAAIRAATSEMDLVDELEKLVV
jgi:hypothetical protein